MTFKNEGNKFYKGKSTFFLIKSYKMEILHLLKKNTQKQLI